VRGDHQVPQHTAGGQVERGEGDDVVAQPPTHQILAVLAGHGTFGHGDLLRRGLAPLVAVPDLGELEQEPTVRGPVLRLLPTTTAAVVVRETGDDLVGVHGGGELAQDLEAVDDLRDAVTGEPRRDQPAVHQQVQGDDVRIDRGIG